MILSCEFLKFSHYPCFWGQRIHCWYFYSATMFEWPRKSRLTSGPTRTRRYWWLCLVDFWNFFTIYVFEVSEPFDDIPTELSCFKDLKNSGHLLVQEVFEVIQTFVHDMPRHVMSRHATLSYVMLRHATSSHVKSRHVTSCHVISRHATACHVMSWHDVKCDVMPRFATSCHIMRCHVMSRHVTS